MEEELGETRYRVNIGEVQSPARYLTALLKKQLENTPTTKMKSNPIPEISLSKNSKVETYFSPDISSMLNELRPVSTQNGFLQNENSMEFPFSNKSIPWATFIGQEYFTLSTNPAKSDRVFTKFRMMEGEVIDVPLIRGKFFPKDLDRGILTAEEGRILGGMESFWVDQGCRFANFNNGAVLCFCNVPIKDLAARLGWDSFGGKDLTHLKQKSINLKTKGYYVELESVNQLRDVGINKGYGFSLVDGIEVLDKSRHRFEQTTLRVNFSDPYSRQLLARRVVSRPKEILTIRSELAFLIRLYLEPILMKRGPHKGHSIELLNLIKILNLPLAKWHEFKSSRKVIFTKPLEELNRMHTIDGRQFNIQIEQGQNQQDFMLVAQLIDSTIPILERN